jgi:hypothetical protein
MSKLFDFLKKNNVEISFEPNRDYTSMPKMIEYSKDLEGRIFNLESKLKQQEEVNKVLMDGLMFYANSDNWASDADSSPDYYDCIDKDNEDVKEDGYKFSVGGKHARQALAKAKEIMGENKI